jgi:hypothetical protein
MPFASIVIPTFNRAHLLARTLQSVVRQATDECEIIVVDDGSTDETERVVRGFPKVRFERQKRQGPGAARNLGWTLAKADYIAFLDSDDVWFPWTLETYRICVSASNSPRFVVGSGFWFSEDGELSKATHTAFRAETYHDYLSTAQTTIWLGASCMLVRRDCQARFETSEMNGEDLDFALHLGEEAGFVWIREPFTFGYRKHGATAVSNFDRTLEGMRHLIHEEQQGRFPGGHARQPERRELVTRSVRPAAVEALKQRRLWPATELYAATFSWHVKLGRWKFLLGFLPAALNSLLTFWVGRSNRLDYELLRHQSGADHEPAATQPQRKRATSAKANGVSTRR